MLRVIYLTVCLVLSAAAGLFYYSQTRQTTAVVAAADLKVGHQIQDSDLVIRDVNPASMPDGIVHGSQQAVGQFVAVPVLQGQFIQVRQITPSRGGQLLKAGLDIPAGFRIVSLPVSPSIAVGGTLRAGDFVDVIATPTAVKTGPGEEAAWAPEVIGRHVLVLGLRTDQGTEPEPGESALNPNSNKAASMLLAIPAPDEARYSLAVSTSSFFFALDVD